MRNGKRLVAYYLPAFYPIPENDKFWGKGFTEWDNCRSAKPLYDGHKMRCHPHPDIGYYEMGLDTLYKQQAMAKKYGVDGWAIYHYWFMGHEPYTRTLDLIMANPDLDLPFCVMFANTDWTRSWDGEPTDILIKQEHDRQDFLNYIRRMIPILADPRYIRIDGKPLLMLYGPDPQFEWAQELWREECVSAGLPEPFLMHRTMTGHGERFYEDVKILDGWDAAYEFPPMGQVCEFTNDHMDDGYCVMDYRSAIAVSAMRETDKRLFRTVMPSWDNSPRKGANGSIMYDNSSPELFSYWLDLATRETDEEIVFINAWNEWGESAVLEPSMELGYANLEALTCRAFVDDQCYLLPFIDEVKGASLHWRGDVANHDGDLDEARRMWTIGARLGNKWCQRNLEGL